MSDDSTVRNLLRRLGSAHLEHTAAAVSPEDVAKTVCAFLNAEGGTIVIEAGHDHPTAEERVKQVEAALRKLLHPAAFWSSAIEAAGNGYYAIIDVPAGRDRPYTSGSDIFIRQGAETVAGSADRIQSLVEAGYSSSERWERRLIPGASVEDLDEGLILETAEEGVRIRDYPFSDAKKPVAVLMDLSLCRQGVITNAGEVLFGLQPALQFPQVRARVTVYESDKGGNYIDNRIFEGPLFRMMEDIFAMIRKHVSIISVFREGLRRTDKPQYPEKAIREGLVNAFAHRDYADFSSGIAVHLYPERLVIWNSGTLPPGLKIGDLKREHPSMPRNPDITQVLYLRQYMERIGRGTQNIVKWCTEAGLPSPIWKADETGVTLTFSARQKLNARQLKLLKELVPQRDIRHSEYCEKYLVSDRQGHRDLDELVALGWLSREGGGPKTVFVRTTKPAKTGQNRADVEE